MRDTSDMMEDTLSEDTMMDCEGDSGGSEDFVDLATDITDNSPSIRDAAERLLTLLGMDDDDDDDDEDLLSSSEDEGVEVDIDEDDEEETDNTKLLHQLAVSLAQELQYSQKQSSPSGSREIHQARTGSMHTVDMVPDASYFGRGCSSQDRAGHPAKTSVQGGDFDHDFVDDDLDERNARFSNAFGDLLPKGAHQKPHSQAFDAASPNRRLWPPVEEPAAATQAPGRLFGSQQDSIFWTAGWEACATKALRYLVEDEGLPLHHPTVVAMKNHLDLQKERMYAQYVGCTETKPRDNMSLLLN